MPLIAAIGVLALSSSVLAADTAPPAQAATADTPEKTPSGATFTLAKDWALATHDHYVVASPAENDTFFAPDLARQMAEAYKAGGAPVEFRMLPPLAGEGHVLINAPRICVPAAR